MQQPLSTLQETYNSSMNTGPDPIVLKSYANAVLDAHRTAAILDHPDSSVTAAKLAENAVETSKIADRVVTAVKIALEAVTAEELAQSAIDTLTNIPNGSITNIKLAEKSVDETNIVDGRVLTEKIANNAITATKLAASIESTGTLTVPIPELP